jgi:DNA-binding NtrC family response regulator/ligand-binding sensor domain-containing protein
MISKSQYMVAFLVLLLTLLLYEKTQSQQDRIQFENISIDQGLSQSIVKCILQDEKGFIYFGTEDGLNRYDGYNFSVMRNNPQDGNSLSYNDITALYEDHLGNLWIGTFNGGLNKYNANNKKITRFLNDPDNGNSISHNNINSIIEDDTGALWIGTDNGLNKIVEDSVDGIYSIERFLSEPANPNGLIHNIVHTISQDQDGIIWVGTEGGLYKLLPNQGDDNYNIFDHYQHNPADPSSLSNNYIRTIFEDGRGNLWLGTDLGLNMIVRSIRDENDISFISYKYNPSNINSISHNEIYSISEDESGVLWIGTNGGGITLFDVEKNEFSRYLNDPQNPRSISYNEIRSVFRDRSGIMWVGLYGGGIEKVYRGAQQFSLYNHKTNNPNSLSHPIIWSICEDKNGILWIGTHGGGLDRLDRENNGFNHYKHNPDDPNSISSDIVRMIYEDSGGILWVGTHGGGLNKFDPQTEIFKTYMNNSTDPTSLGHNEIRGIYKDKLEILWIGTYGGGLDRFDKETETFRHYRNDPGNPTTISNDFVRIIYEDNSGGLWIGTEGGGLNKYNRETDTFKHFRSDPTDSASISNDYIFTIHEDKSGILWLGTWGGGLNKFDPETEKFSYYTINDGLPSDAIYGILEDEAGNLWMSTNNGLSRFNPETESFKNYSVKDGLQNTEFNGGSYFKSKNGEMFFGGITGFNSFYPENIKDNKYIPPVVITSFQKFNNPVHFNRPVYEIQEIDLSYKDYVFSFEFSALDYAAPEKNEYAYKMEGLDDDWIYTDSERRYATYTTLSPGKYTFRVKGTNSDGIWNEEGASIIIIINPPFWQTWWFRTIIIFLVLISAFSFYKRRINKIEEKKKDLAERLNEKTIAATALQNALSEVELLKNRLYAENIYLQDEIKLQHNFENIITQSEALKKLLHKVEQVASTDATVLILGESGTGKELFTRAIHNVSDRGERPLVKVNCSALPANLIESELFGYEKGAFTGATARKIGRFELADGGTIFLDEIGDLPLELQPKILRVLQESEFDRIGNPNTIKVDVRIIAATNRDLMAEINKGNFREDLFYRLNVFPISIPPLRERKEDIPLLVNHLVNEYSAKIGKKIETVSQTIMNMLQTYNWPGNVRELENIIERAIITSKGKNLTLSDWLPKTETVANNDEILTIQENEKQHIIKALEKTDWKISGENGAAEILGIKRTTLEARMKKLNIQRKK